MKWSPEEEHLLRLLIPTNTYTEIAVEFERRFNKSLPGFRQLRSSEAIRKKCQRDSISSSSTADYTDPYESRWNVIKRLGEEYKLIAEECNVGVVDQISRKILTLSDIHFPFAREEDIEQALNDHADADVVVLNGDILDGDVFSTYGGAKRIAALKEYAAAFELVAYCAENFSQVVIVSGNHDRRPAKALARSDFQKNASQILRPDLLARIANGERLDQFGDIAVRDD